jgi:short subunit fatty acids transporter
MTSTLFESFMIFYLLEVIVLGVIAFQLLRDIKKETIEEEMRNNQESRGPSASDLIKMRALAKQMDRQK